MSESGTELSKVVEYMKAHWPSKVKEEWQVGVSEYAEIVKRAVSDLTVGATAGRRLIRIAGISGSGKTTQILPAVEAYCSVREILPVLVAARVFVKYHPHYAEISKFYGEENVRKMTDEFATIMLFLVLSALIRGGYDIVLDVTLLDPEMEGILVKMVREGRYEMMLLMVAVSPVVTEKFLAGRAWRHSKETELEFVRATVRALEFYANALPDGRVVMWSVYDLLPVYDGELSECLEAFNEYSAREEMPGDNDDARREAKIKYLTTG
ncbi:zeta toxin family protein [Candidatus Saccharibacteria bacterium]|nr:zeta toxin family protein [Candidatus Saccharibacteria bacterium]